jgi:hypothetical protein
MTDEHLMRLWADSHQGSSADLDRGILKLGAHLRGRREPQAPIGLAYKSGACAVASASPEVSAMARAALAGVTACLATMGLLLTVALLATADLHPAAAYPLVTHTIVA